MVVATSHHLQSFAVVGECCGLRNRPRERAYSIRNGVGRRTSWFAHRKVPPIHAVVRQPALICPSARLPLASYASRQAGSRGFGACHRGPREPFAGLTTHCRLGTWHSNGWTTSASSSRTWTRRSSSFASSASSSKGEPWWKESGQGASLDWATSASRSP